MAEWYEVFDHEQVQFETRRRVARLAAGVIGLSVAVLGIAPLLLAFVDAPLLVTGLVGIALLATMTWASRAFIRLRRVVWCVKLSVHRVVGYDYARRKTVLAWADIERVELNEAGLLIAEAPREGRPGRVLCLPFLFPDFARLSHRVVEYAEAHGLPVCIDGRPWQLLDVPAIYPFMAAYAIAGCVERGGHTLEGGEEA